jgi:hypothetical protein
LNIFFSKIVSKNDNLSFIPEFGSCDFQNANISKLIGNYNFFIVIQLQCE